jgi:hypothetical protein
MTTSDRSNLHQLRVNYDALQDRLLLGANTVDGKEFRFWLTRRFLVIFWGILSHVLQEFAARRAPADPLLRSALTDFAEARALSQADLKTPYAGGADHPLGEAPVLLSRVAVSPGPGGQQTISLRPESGQGIDLALDESLANVLAKLVRDAAANGDWALDLGSPPVGFPAAASGMPPRLH